MKMSDNTSRRAALAAAVALALLPAVTLAQEATAQEPATAAPGEVAAQDATTLDTIFVTANKRVENIREVAASISVIGEEQLDNLHATQLTDFAAYVPGMQVNSGGPPGLANISLRGIAALSSSTTIGTYIDETPMGSSGLYQAATTFAVDLLPYDIARVEVLRGPQGTLYGAGAMGGLLKYVTRDPDLSNTEFRFGGGVSDVKGAGDLGWNARFGANLPLVEDRLALRVSYARNQIPGYIDNALDGREDINDGTHESARVALLWQASDEVSLKLVAMRQSIDSDNSGLVALEAVAVTPDLVTSGAPLAGDLTNALYFDEPFKKDIDFYSATLDWDLGWADFTAASGYSDVSTDRRQDATLVYGEIPLLFGLPTGISYFDLGLDLQKFTQEFRLTSKASGPFQWQVGAFYTKEEADNSQIVRLYDLDGTPAPTGLDPLAVQTLPSEYQEIAVFGNASYRFTDRFELGAGVRFSRDDQEFAQIATEGILLVPGTTRGGSEEDVFTWHVAPQFQWTDDAMLYARIATGYQAGGPNAAVPGVPPQVDASTLTSYELGLKSEFLDRRVLFDLAVFRIDWDDIQVSDTDGSRSWLVNGGQAVSQGVELSTAFKPSERWRLGWNAAYTDATFSNDVPSLGAFDGDRLPTIPRFSWSATADYFYSLGGDWNGRVGGGYRWVGDRTQSSGPDLDSYGALDLNADIANAHWTLRAYVKNLTDKRAYHLISPATGPVTGETSLFLAAPIQPRTVGVEFDYRF